MKTISLRGNLAYTPRRTHVVLGIIVLLAIALRVYALPRWSASLDEIRTILRSQNQLLPLLFADDFHPPLHYLIVRLWSLTFGTGISFLRIPSTLFSVAAVIGIFALGRKLFDYQTGLIAALLVAISPVHIHYGWKARMYSAFIFFTIASIYYLFRLHEGRRTTALYVGSTTALLYSHGFSVFVVIAQNLYMLWKGSQSSFGIRRSKWIRTQFFVGLLYLPWGVWFGRKVISAIFGSGGENGSLPGWIPDPSFNLIMDMLYMFGGDPYFYPILAGNSITRLVSAWILVIFAGAFLLTLVAVYLPPLWTQVANTFSKDRFQPSTRKDKITVLTVLLIIPIALPYLASIITVPIFFPRYMVAVTVPLFLLVAYGIRLVPRTLDRGLLLLLLIASSLFLTATYYQGETEEPWEQSSAVLESHANEGDLIIVYKQWTINRIEYYYDGSADFYTILSAGSLDADQRSRLAGELRNRDRVCVHRYQNPSSSTAESIIQEIGFDRIVEFEQGAISVSCYGRSV